MTYTNADRTYQALKKLDFLAVSDFFMTPTAALADIVLPAATFLEYDSVVAPSYYPFAQVQQKSGTGDLSSSGHGGRKFYCGRRLGLH
jgi:anaerobic selenocysteine-containing dehydrogenase